MHIAIIGSGYVGLVSGTCFAEFGNTVVCADKDHDKIERLARGELPIYEPGLGEMLERNVRAGRLRFTADAGEAVHDSLAVFIAVGTPSRGDGSADLQYIEDVARLIAKHLDSYKVIVTKSTVPVGTGRWIRGIIEEELADAPAPAPGPLFDVAANPEFLREGAAVEDFVNPDRVVIGAESSQAVAILQSLYRPLYRKQTPVVVTTLETAELIKYASNAFLATKISFINEMAALAEPLGVDVQQVARAMGLDRRIGERFLNPGPGFGGSCFPKDLRALAQIGQAHHSPMRLVETALEVNETQRLRMIRKIVRAVTGSSGESLEGLTARRALEGRTIGVLGLAFKADTDDVREAPALVICAALLAMGAVVRAWDPAALAAGRLTLPALEPASDPYGVALGADAVCVMTEWKEFLELDLARLRSAMRGRAFVDLRNLYDPARMRALGFDYESVGRAITTKETTGNV
jgi:UDPglucose 6-dehydrogenase